MFFSHYVVFKWPAYPFGIFRYLAAITLCTFYGQHSSQDKIDERNIVWLFEIDGLDTEEKVPTDVINFAIGIKNPYA